MPKYGRINLDIVAISGDSVDDADSLPQVDLVSGTATISATLRSGSADISGIDGLTEKKIQLPQPVSCTVADGKLTRAGHQHVTLLSPSTTWTWQISFDDLYVGNVPLVLDSFTFPVEEATEAQLEDTSWHGDSIAPYAAERYSGPSLSESAVARLVDILDDTMPHIVDAIDKYPDMQDWHGDVDAWQAQVAEDRQTAQGASASATSSASAAAGSASDAADSEQAAATSASNAATSAGVAQSYAEDFDLTVAGTSTGAEGSDASVAVTGDGPAYDLSFTIPRGNRGDQGPAGLQEVAWTDDGRPYLLDVAAAEQGDSGWRTIDTKSNSGGNPNRLDIRRVGDRCYARVYGQPGWADDETITFTGTPDGFKHELGRFHDNAYGAVSSIVVNIGNGKPTACGHITYRLWVSQEIQVRITNNGTRHWVAELEWFTTDDWPETLPGTAAV